MDENDVVMRGSNQITTKHIPTDLVTKISSYMQGVSVLKVLMNVCKEWRECLNTDYLWKERTIDSMKFFNSLIRQKKKYSASDFEKYPKFIDYKTRFRMTWCYYKDKCGFCADRYPKKRRGVCINTIQVNQFPLIICKKKCLNKEVYLKTGLNKRYCIKRNEYSKISSFTTSGNPIFFKIEVAQAFDINELEKRRTTRNQRVKKNAETKFKNELTKEKKILDDLVAKGVPRHKALSIIQEKLPKDGRAHYFKNIGLVDKHQQHKIIAHYVGFRNRETKCFTKFKETMKREPTEEEKSEIIKKLKDLPNRSYSFFGSQIETEERKNEKAEKYIETFLNEKLIHQEFSTKIETNVLPKISIKKISKMSDLPPLSRQILKKEIDELTKEKLIFNEKKERIFFSPEIDDPESSDSSDDEDNDNIIFGMQNIFKRAIIHNLKQERKRQKLLFGGKSNEEMEKKEKQFNEFPPPKMQKKSVEMVEKELKISEVVESWGLKYDMVCGHLKNNVPELSDYLQGKSWKTFWEIVYKIHEVLFETKSMQNVIEDAISTLPTNKKIEMAVSGINDALGINDQNEEIGPVNQDCMEKIYSWFKRGNNLKRFIFNNKLMIPNFDFSKQAEEKAENADSGSSKKSKKKKKIKKKKKKVVAESDGEYKTEDDSPYISIDDESDSDEKKYVPQKKTKKKDKDEKKNKSMKTKKRRKMMKLCCYQILHQNLQ